MELLGYDAKMEHLLIHVYLLNIYYFIYFSFIMMYFRLLGTGEVDKPTFNY